MTSWWCHPLGSLEVTPWKFLSRSSMKGTIFQPRGLPFFAPPSALPRPVTVQVGSDLAGTLPWHTVGPEFLCWLSGGHGSTGGEF